MLFQALIYFFATSSLLVATLLTFDKNEIPDYFYLMGTVLFVLNSTININSKFQTYRRSQDYYPPLLVDENIKPYF